MGTTRQSQSLLILVEYVKYSPRNNKIRTNGILTQGNSTSTLSSSQSASELQRAAKRAVKSNTELCWQNKSGGHKAIVRCGANKSYFCALCVAAPMLTICKRVSAATNKFGSIQDTTSVSCRPHKPPHNAVIYVVLVLLVQAVSATTNHYSVISARICSQRVARGGFIVRCTSEVQNTATLSPYLLGNLQWAKFWLK